MSCLILSSEYILYPSLLNYPTTNTNRIRALLHFLGLGLQKCCLKYPFVAAMERSGKNTMKEYCEIGRLLCESGDTFPLSSPLSKCPVCGTLLTHHRPGEKPHLCDACRHTLITQDISQALLAHRSTSPVNITLDVMVRPSFNICGKEFLYLICGSLLTAYSNVAQSIDLPKQLRQAQSLTDHIPGGACSLWSSFGTAMAAKVFIGMLADLNGLHALKRDLERNFLFKVLGEIASTNMYKEVIRCCRHNAVIVLSGATAFVQEYFNLSLCDPVHPTCSFDNFPHTCGQTSCSLHPRPGASLNTANEKKLATP